MKLTAEMIKCFTIEIGNISNCTVIAILPELCEEIRNCEIDCNISIANRRSSRVVTIDLLGRIEHNNRTIVEIVLSLE